MNFSRIEGEHQKEHPQGRERRRKKKEEGNKKKMKVATIEPIEEKEKRWGVTDLLKEQQEKMKEKMKEKGSIDNFVGCTSALYSSNKSHFYFLLDLEENQ